MTGVDWAKIEPSEALAELMRQDACNRLHTTARGHREALGWRGPRLRPADRARPQVQEFDDTDGRWIFAQCVLDRPPEWVRRGTAASFAGTHLLDPSDIGGWKSSHSARVTEVSLLTPSEKPAESRAQVVLLERSAAPAHFSARGAAEHRPSPAGAVFYGGGLIRRPAIGQVLGVR